MAEERTSYDEKLALILRTAAAVFADKGYHRASIREISRASGISLSGLYYYFKSKHELLFLIQDHCFGTLIDNLERRLEGEVDPQRRLYLFVENHLRFFAANMKEMKVLSHEAGSLEGEYHQRVSRKKRRYTDLCLGIIEELSADDEPIDARVAVFSLFGMLNWIYNWYRPERDLPVSELAEEMSRLFLSGFLGGAVPALPGGGWAGGEASPSIWRR
jgi:AcrR family transcriptional regulator